jgi:hypothetical protein
MEGAPASAERAERSLQPASAIAVPALPIVPQQTSIVQHAEAIVLPSVHPKQGAARTKQAASGAAQLLALSI